MPEAAIASFGITLHPDDPEALKARLLGGDPPVVGRIVDGAVLLDMLTVDDDEVDDLAAAVRVAL